MNHNQIRAALATLDTDFAVATADWSEFLTEKAQVEQSLQSRSIKLSSRLHDLEYLSRLQIIDGQMLYVHVYLYDEIYQQVPNGDDAPVHSATFNAASGHVTLWLSAGDTSRSWRLEAEDKEISRAAALAFVLSGTLPTAPWREFDSHGFLPHAHPYTSPWAAA
jgi:hypothetical protein